MLCLSRMRDERILIGDPPIAVVTVVDIGYGRVRLGFEADQQVRIDREEVRLKRQQEQAK